MHNDRFIQTAYEQTCFTLAAPTDALGRVQAKLSARRRSRHLRMTGMAVVGACAVAAIAQRFCAARTVIASS